MAVNAGAPRPTIAAAFPPIPLRRRLTGFGSIYGKTIRDSRLAFIIAAGLLGGIALVMGAAIGTVFPTPADRLEVDKLIGSMPASMVNLFGNATLLGPKLGTLGGYMTLEVRRDRSPSAPRSGRSSRCRGPSPARRRAAASTSSQPLRSASAGSRSRSWPPT